MLDRCHRELSYSMWPTTDPSAASNSSRKISTLELPVCIGSTLLVLTPSRSMPASSDLGCNANRTCTQNNYVRHAIHQEWLMVRHAVHQEWLMVRHAVYQEWLMVRHHELDLYASNVGI